MNKSKISCKYNKITQQKKFHLLTLVLKDKLLIKQAAKIVGINYSTAKTIIFFNRNHGKSYQFDIQQPLKQEKPQIRKRANVLELSFNFQYTPNSEPCSNFVDIISTIGMKNSIKSEGSYSHDFTKRQNFQNSDGTHNGIHVSHSYNENLISQGAQIEKRLTRARSALLKTKGFQQNQERQLEENQSQQKKLQFQGQQYEKYNCLT